MASSGLIRPKGVRLCRVRTADLPRPGNGGVELIHLIALVITISIIAHSSSDVPIAHWFASTANDHE
ncbi:MAG: hypothetical protein M0Z94_04255 [Dehalococcoidales bacterium]|nr:hypothetical protein [Dehalococcoidales bacterium]